MKHELIMAVVATAAIYHNGKHYNIGDEIEVTEAEFNELAIYLEPKDEAVKARQKAQAEAEEKAQAIAEAANAEKLALEQALRESQEAHAQAEALATENGLRAEEAQARVVELEQQLATAEAALAEKEEEIAKISAKLTACKSEKSGKGNKAKPTEKAVEE